MKRRDLMTMTGAALLFGGGRALAQSASPQSSKEAKVVRIYATPDRGSHVEELTTRRGRHGPNRHPRPG